MTACAWARMEEARTRDGTKGERERGAECHDERMRGRRVGVAWENANCTKDAMSHLPPLAKVELLVDAILVPLSDER